jgi:hypothetical protein
MARDKRKDERFLVGKEVIVALQNTSPRVGRVKDISMGGLSFEHIYDENLQVDPLKRDVSLWVDDYSVADIPCRVVYDIPISESPEYDYLSVHFKTRRCGVQFGELTVNQETQLDFFLKTHTKGKI